MTVPKRPSITAALATAAGKPQPQQEPEATPAPADEQKKKKETGLVPVAAHYPPEVRKILKMIAAEKGKSLKQVLGEAINDLCSKYNKPQPYSDDEE